MALHAEQAGTITTLVTAEVSAGKSEFPLYTETFTHSSLVQDHTYAFELLSVSDLPDARALRFNEWSEDTAIQPGDHIATGQTFPGEPGDQAVSVFARFYDVETGQNVPGIERFALSLTDAAGAVVFGPSTDWQTGPDGSSSLTFASPGPGRFQLTVSDLGEETPCVTITPPKGAALSLLNSGREKLIWIILLGLLVVSAIVLGAWWLICIRAPALKVNLEADLALESAPTDENGYSLADLPRNVQLYVLENPSKAIRKIEAGKGKLHVFLEVEGYVENPFVCGDEGLPALQAKDDKPLSLFSRPDLQSAILLHLRQATAVSVLERLDGWDRLQVTLIGYVDAALSARLEGSFRRCYLPPLSVRTQTDTRLSSAPLANQAFEVLRMLVQGEVTVLEDESEAMRKIESSHGWLSVQTRLAGYVREAVVEENGETLIRVPQGQQLQIHELPGGKGDVLGILKRSCQARLVEQVDGWEKVEVLAQGFIPSRNAHTPSRPEGLERPDRPRVLATTLPVRECEKPAPDESDDRSASTPERNEPEKNAADRPPPEITESKPDDSKKPIKDELKLIEGIGPKVEALLHSHGVTTFAQLAARDPSPEQIQAWVNAAGWPYMLPETWPQQAALAEAGLWEQFEALIKYLKAGRKPGA